MELSRIAFFFKVFYDFIQINPNSDIIHDYLSSQFQHQERTLCFMFLFCLVFAMFCARLFICALWSPAGKGMTSWLSFVVYSVSLSLSHWYPGSGVVLDCIDS